MSSARKLLRSGINELKVLWLTMIVNELTPIVERMEPETARRVQEQLSQSHYIILLFGLFLIGISALHSLIVSRSVAGPVFAIKRHLKKCSEAKKWTDIRIRKDDLFQDLVDDLNTTGQALSAPAGAPGKQSLRDSPY